MFTESAMFFHEFVASKLGHMTRCLSMLKMDIRSFMCVLCYGSLVDSLEAARKRKTEIELQKWEQR